MYSPPPPRSSSDASSGGAYDRKRPSASARAPARGARVRLPTPSQWLLLAGGVLTIAGAALPWWSVTLPGDHKGATLALAGWDTASGKAVTVLGALVLLLALVRLLRIALPAAVAERERVVYVALGGEELLLALLALLDGVHVFAAGGYVAASAGIGLYLGLVGAVAVLAGGWLHEADAAWML